MSESGHSVEATRAGSVFSPKGTAGRLIFAWLWVGIPLVLGIALTVQSSLPLFRAAPTPAASATTK